MKKQKVWILLLAALTLAGGAVFWLEARRDGASSSGRKVLYWVDPMNPAFRSPQPGTAPCGMPLEAVYEEGTQPGATSVEAGASSGTVRVSPERRQLIGVRVAPAVRAAGTHTLRLLGRVTADETRVYRVTAGTDGWIMGLAPVTTGSIVRTGDILATFYSFELMTGIQAYVNSVATIDRYGRGNREASKQARHSAGNADNYRNSLRNLGMSELQLDELDRTRTAPEAVEIRAPGPGLIVGRNVSLEQRFQKGTELYQIADLRRIWVLADLFGGEAQELKPGLAVTVRLPDQGMAFAGRVSQIKPQFDPSTRTLKIRVEVDNPEYLLRPDMFVDVELPLALGPGLFVPKEAVLDSGMRRLVFVEQGAGVFVPRTVRTGRRLGEQVEIVGGLMEGERVVTSGNFLLDSESRMRAAGAEAAGAALDPICGMEVEETRARAAGLVSGHGGKTWFFCSDDCKAAFDRDPAKAAARAEGLQMPPAGEAALPVAAAAGHGGGHEAMAVSAPMQRMAPSRVPEQMPDQMAQPGAATTPSQAPAAGGVEDRAAGAGGAERAVDPVCRMEVDAARARAEGRFTERDGETWYFDSAACKREFDADPTPYLPVTR